MNTSALPRDVASNIKKIEVNSSFTSIFVFYQITIRLSGAIYILSVSLTSNALYHSLKFLGGIFARKIAGP